MVMMTFPRFDLAGDIIKGVRQLTFSPKDFLKIFPLSHISGMHIIVWNEKNEMNYSKISAVPDTVTMPDPCLQHFAGCSSLKGENKIFFIFPLRGPHRLGQICFDQSS